MPIFAASFWLTSPVRHALDMTVQEYNETCSRIRRQIKSVLEDKLIDIRFDDYQEACNNDLGDEAYSYVSVITEQVIYRAHLVEMAWYGFRLRTVGTIAWPGHQDSVLFLGVDCRQFVLDHQFLAL